MKLRQSRGRCNLVKPRQMFNYASRCAHWRTNELLLGKQRIILSNPGSKSTQFNGRVSLANFVPVNVKEALSSAVTKCGS